MMSNITKWRAVSHAGLPDWISLTHTGPHGGLNERNSSNVTQRTCLSRTVNGCEEMKSQQSPLYSSGLLTKAGRHECTHTGSRLPAAHVWALNEDIIEQRSSAGVLYCHSSQDGHEKTWREKKRSNLCGNRHTVQTCSCGCFQLLAVWMFQLQGHRLWMFSSTFKWFKCPV